MSLLHQLVYQSQAMVPFDAPALLVLEQQAQAYNRAHGVSGVLLYTPDGRFLQLLEGDELAVRFLYDHRIVPDPRHRDCHVLAQGPCQARSFTGWAMELCLAQPADVRTLLACVPSANLAVPGPRARTVPELAVALFTFFTTGRAEVPEPQLAS